MVGSQRSLGNLFVKQPQSSKSLSGARTDLGEADAEAASWADLETARRLSRDTSTVPNMPSDRQSDRTYLGRSQRELPTRHESQASDRRQRERNAQEYMRATAPRDGPSGPRRQSSRSPPPRERRESRIRSPRSPPRSLRTNSPPRMPKQTPIRQKPLNREETSPTKNITPSDPADSHKNFTEMFMTYAKSLSALTSLELRKDEAKRIKEVKCADFDKCSSLHKSFPSTYETQFKEKRKAIEYFEKLRKEYESQEQKLSMVLEEMAAVVPSNKGMDPVKVQELQELQERCLNLEDELSTTLGKLEHVNSEFTSFKDQVNNKVNGYEQRAKQTKEFEDLQRQVVELNIQVKQLHEARSDHDKNTRVRNDEFETLKKDLASTSQKFETLGKMLSDETGALDLHGMRKTIESTTEKVEDISRQLHGDDGFKVRLDHMEAESREVVDRTTNVFPRQLEQLGVLLDSSPETERQVTDLKSRVEDLGNLETIVTKYAENFRTVHSNIEKANEVHGDLQARIMKLEQAKAGGPALTQQVNTSLTKHQTLALQTELRRFDLDLKEKAKSNQAMLLRIKEILENNSETTLPAALSILEKKVDELQCMVRNSMDKPDQLQCDHISIGINALATSMDLLSFRIEQEERDMVLDPELSKIGQIAQLDQEIRSLKINSTKLLEEQKTTFDKHLENLQKQIEEINLAMMNRRQSNNTFPVPGSSPTGFNPSHLPSPVQQSYGQRPPQYANQPNGIMNGVPNGNLQFGGPHLEINVAELKADITKLQNHLNQIYDSTTMGINNLDHRMNNLSTGNVVKFMADHLQNMYPEVRNAASELAKLHQKVDNLRTSLRTEIEEVRRIANRNWDISDRIKTLEKAHADCKERLEDNSQDLLRGQKALEDALVRNVSRMDQLEGKVGNMDIDALVKGQNDAFEQLRRTIDVRISELQGSRDEIQQKLWGLNKTLSDEVAHFHGNFEDISTDFVRLQEDVIELQKGNSVGAKNNAGLRTSSSATPTAPSSRPPTATETLPVKKRASAATSNGESMSRKKKRQSMLWRDDSDGSG